jgi:hypothetical protein
MTTAFTGLGRRPVRAWPGPGVSDTINADG